MAPTNVTEEDEGKHVVTSTGETIGMITQIEGDRVHVDPDPGITDTIRSKLGWGDADKDDYILEQQRIDTITDDEIRLKE